MRNIIDINYAQTSQSTKLNTLGMREMQERAYAVRDAQYLLIKAPPASGKSRALMYIALDKLAHQGIKKVIVAVPERSIAGSFKPVDLKSHGFFEDWQPNPEFNLCLGGADKSKIKTFIRFMNIDEKILICTHATLRFAFDEIDTEQFNNTLVVIDEFHHVSSDSDNSRLGRLLHAVMEGSNAHVVAMTGSYFRGDAVPVLMPEDEERFTKVTYNYYEQLNGYTYLKSLGLAYPFYQGKYTSAIGHILNTDQKTILHIPNVNSGESTKDKYQEVYDILDIIGEVDHQDQETGIIYLKRHSDGKMLKIANLVEESQRDRVINYLRNIKNVDDMDLIIALGMAKEGFDWPFCEHALTVGCRGSLTEVVQIIGRCTRDSPNKTHAQFTNLLAQPNATDDQITLSVNNMLKAITCSLLMEQVLAPNFKFKTRSSDHNKSKSGEIHIRGFKEPSTARVEKIIESDLPDLKVSILQDDTMIRAISGNLDPEVINKIIIPKIIRLKYPDLSENEVEEVRQYVVADSIVKAGVIQANGNQRFIRIAEHFINIDDLHIDLIDQINPFYQAVVYLSKTVTADVLHLIQEAIEATRIDMSDEEAMLLWPKIKQFVRDHNGNRPDINSSDPLERVYASALIYLKKARREQHL
ncbi:MAG: DEAD/DEAH box helicase family protein [Gammaproteobacteria bacterium]|nr:DEAD/DEAH box helicase family protein [Gammaproteobacteria bacterium]